MRPLVVVVLLALTAGGRGHTGRQNGRPPLIAGKA
jgi:hypothetical protein